MRLKDIITIEELAKEFGVSERTVRRWEEEMGMPVVQIGDLKRVYFPNFMKWFLSYESRRERSVSPNS